MAHTTTTCRQVAQVDAHDMTLRIMSELLTLIMIPQAEVVVAVTVQWQWEPT